MKYILIPLLLASTSVLASNYHHNNSTPVNNYYTTEEYIINEYITNEYVTTESYAATTEYKNSVNDYVNDGVALNLSAAALQFDWATNDWQYSGGLGNYENRTAGSVGLAKRVGSWLLNGSYNRSLESGNEGYNLGFTGRFK